MVKHWSVRCPSITLRGRVQAAKAGCPAGRPAGFSAASPHHHRVFRGMNLGDVDQSTLGGQGGRHEEELTSQIVARSSPAHGTAGTRRGLSLPPPPLLPTARSSGDGRPKAECKAMTRAVTRAPATGGRGRARGGRDLGGGYQSFGSCCISR